MLKFGCRTSNDCEGSSVCSHIFDEGDYSPAISTWSCVDKCKPGSSYEFKDAGCFPALATVLKANVLTKRILATGAMSPCQRPVARSTAARFVGGPSVRSIHLRMVTTVPKRKIVRVVGAM